jgi:UDP-N-acetylmuramate--alanine ligase
MIRLDDISRIYFIGIGGIGMSALARYFNHRGAVVSGYDRTATPLTEALTKEGLNIHYTDDIELLDKDVQLVVYTPAIPAAHTELNWYRDNGYTVVKRSEVLGIITEGSFNICVAGTHGKTSISTMVAHLLRHTGYGCNAFLGGVSANYGTNFWASERNVCVIEADEYDRSFLKLSPDVAVVTSMDPDHLDIYLTAEAMEDAFIAFSAKVKSGGLLLRHHSLTRLNEAMVRRQLTYSLHLTATAGHHHHEDEEADMPDVYVSNIENAGNGYRFDVVISGEKIDGLEMQVGGLHNIENMTAAITIARMLQISPEAIAAAVKAYKGVKRRFEYVLAGGDHLPILIDDYAHHPGELEALLRSVRGLYPGKKITIVFQPHLFSRTNDFAEGFAQSLEMADTAVLLPIYPARELPMAGVTSATIGRHMKLVEIIEKDALPDWVQQHESDVWVMAGAGDIDALVPKVKAVLTEKYGVEK